MRSVLTKRIRASAIGMIKGITSPKKIGYIIIHKDDIFMKLLRTGLDVSSKYGNVMPVFVNYGALDQKPLFEIYGTVTPLPSAAIERISNLYYRTNDKFSGISEIIMQAGIDGKVILFGASGLSHVGEPERQKIVNELDVLSRSPYNTVVITDQVAPEDLPDLKRIDTEL